MNNFIIKIHYMNGEDAIFGPFVGPDAWDFINEALAAFASREDIMSAQVYHANGVPLLITKEPTP